MNNPFAEMHTDTVYIGLPDGSRSKPYKTRVGSKDGKHVATVFDDSFDAQEGDLLFRELPNGREESYKILEVNYSPGLHAIPPNWSLKLQKETSLLQTAQAKQIPNITINNSQGIQIGDHNVQHIASSLQGLIEQIESANGSNEEKAEAKGHLAKLLESPVVVAILGNAVTGVMNLLK